jgi:K+/H+ antiporter YhaU regulatory subunit KhtT
MTLLYYTNSSFQSLKCLPEPISVILKMEATLSSEKSVTIMILRDVKPQKTCHLNDSQKPILPVIAVQEAMGWLQNR